LLDQSGGRAKGLKQFLDDKSYKRDCKHIAVTTDTRPAIERLLRRARSHRRHSPQPKSPGAQVLANIENFEYPATVHLVSRNRTEVLGGVRPDDRRFARRDRSRAAAVPSNAVLDSMQACARVR